MSTASGLQDADKRIPFQPPVDPSQFGRLFVVLGVIGLLFLSWFFVYEVSVRKQKRNLFKELALGMYFEKSSWEPE